MSNSSESGQFAYAWVLEQIAKNSKMNLSLREGVPDTWGSLSRQLDGIFALHTIAVSFHFVSFPSGRERVHVVSRFETEIKDNMGVHYPLFDNYLDAIGVLIFHGKRFYRPGDVKYETGVLKVSPDLWQIRSPSGLLALFQAYVKLAAFRRKDTLFSL